MAIVRWDPVNELPALRTDMNRLFDSFFLGRTGGDAGGHRGWVPAMDLVETERDLVLKADLPGMKQEDIEVEVKDNLLSISGERRSEHEQHENGFYRVERSQGHFARSVTLPDGIDGGQVKASYEDGVLEVRIPKPAERQPTRIEVTGREEGSKVIEAEAAPG